MPSTLKLSPVGLVWTVTWIGNGVGLGPIVCTAFPLLEAKTVSDEYLAVMVWLPVFRVDVLNDADPSLPGAALKKQSYHGR